MTRRSLADVIAEQNKKTPQQPPKMNWLSRVMFSDRSGKTSPTRQLSIFVPTLFVCMMATTIMMRNKLSVKLEDIDDETKNKLKGKYMVEIIDKTFIAHRESVSELFREKKETDMDEVLLDYETRLWSNGYQNKAVPRSLDQQAENDSNEDDDVGDD